MATESTPLTAHAGGDHGGRAMSRRRQLITGVMVGAALAALVVGWLVWGGGKDGSDVDVDVPTINGEALFCGLRNHEHGYISLPNRKDDHYFYWYFPAENATGSEPWILWLQGGPGCSGVAAIAHENGPCRINRDLTTTLNPYSWTKRANVIWLDQPTNTGFSVGSNDEVDATEESVRENIYWFLQEFLKKHPEFLERPLYLAGESYAGHYIPATAHYIWEQNQKSASGVPSLPLTGLAIGNGLTNPIIQSAHMLDMANNSYNIKIAKDEDLSKAQEAVQPCVQQIEACQTNTSVCVEALQFCQTSLMAPFVAQHVNPLDLRMKCADVPSSEGCYDFKHVTAYMNSHAVHKYLNVSSRVKEWQECREDVELRFLMSGDPMKRFDTQLVDLLNEGKLRLLVYVGDADLMCNWHGNLAWMEALEWKGQTAFQTAEEHAFKLSNGTQVGLARDSPQMTFVRVFNAGHLVAMDQPAVALELISRFIDSKPF
ncbi:TPA: hypothetical protein N0F65_002360 [Lagenidium giganteum]|uniref:Carboxypeptidase n=1 Tax=Lagenidium giganteum TaxID=4803 RepID=A0AAV2YPK0_9STRA|nr:TPA: hypothetical protein N0F65_002360 [Lagenidium giganteum]